MNEQQGAELSFGTKLSTLPYSVPKEEEHPYILSAQANNQKTS